MTFTRIWLVFMWIGLAGCQTPASLIAQSSCSFDEVWDTAIASLEGAWLQSADKARGRVETAWLELESSTRAGILRRDVNKERVKFLITVAPQRGGVTATVQQLRETWSPMGARMRQWRAILANQSEEADLTAKISSRLREKGC